MTLLRFCLSHLNISCRKVSTIFALSSGSLPSAIAIVRLSGPESFSCLQKLTRRKSITPRFLFFANLYDRKGALIDRSMSVFLPGPSTFTGEDTVELYVHGGRAIVDCLCQTLEEFKDVRAAKAGEFTKRAFYNSKLSLLDVEALSDLLAAETQRQRRVAVRQKQLGNLLNEIRNHLVNTMSQVEAGIDFADEVGFDISTILPSVALIIDQLEKIELNASRGLLIRNGIHVVLIGETNVGKSSLMNRLAEREIAIVSDIAGTTRDAIETRIELHSIPIYVTDTAGIRTSDDTLERKGISKTIEKVSESDIVVVVVDARSNTKDEDVRMLLKNCLVRNDQFIIVVSNKCDLSDNEMVQLSWPQIMTSCLEGKGIEELIEEISKAVKNICPDEGNDMVISRQRHLNLVRQAICSLKEVNETDDLALIAQHLRNAADAIGEITGAIVNEHILDRIFSSFCIGK
ncbi:hypothetical protein AB6A40_007268 [Gnathostoma spinigerum]|uniref:TrmE-type G domain-containing protein n=1 Tax=Gnathostoma spinigerum TaxID=75299 RepID=A0ABD6EQW3_9BILA